MNTSTTTAGPWLDDVQQEAWRGWLAVTSRLPVELHRRLQRGSDLSLPDFDVLVQLSEHDDGRMRVSGLAHALQWERSRLSHHVARMERRGLVGREECDDDGRGHWVVITAAGRAAIEAAAPDHVAVVRELFFDALDDDDVQALRAITAKVTRRLDARGSTSR